MSSCLYPGQSAGIAGIQHHVCLAVLLGTEPRAWYRLDRQSTNWLCSSCCGSFIAVILIFSHGVFVVQASLELTAVLPQFLGAGIAGVSSRAQFSTGQICTPLTAESGAGSELMDGSLPLSNSLLFVLKQVLGRRWPRP